MASLYSQGSARPAKPRLTPLPTYTHEKSYLTSSPSAWTTTVFIPIPRTPGRRCKLILPIPPRLWQNTIGFGRRRPRIMTLVVLMFLWLVVSTWRKLGMHQRQWKVPGLPDPPTLVFAREDLQRVWQWEIASGHYPSKKPIPTEIGLTEPPFNPGLPRRKHANPGSDSLPSRFRAPVKQAIARSDSIGTGAKRTYLDIQSKPPTTSYPPRPYPGSIADMDTIMDLCSFPDNYVRDCLEVLRLGGGLDNEMRVRRGKMDEWKYIYMEEPVNDTVPAKPSRPTAQVPLNKEDPNAGLTFKWRSELEPHLKLPDPLTPRFPTGDPDADPCDPDHQRIYHMYWTGPFTDKPYLALMSYLFTQNLGLHLPMGTPVPKNVCRPQFWMWINPATAAAELAPTAMKDMFDQLAASPWAAPFLHSRFKDVIKFKLWNTTEQLDGVPELKNEWRALKDNLFNSGGYLYAVPKAKEEERSSTTTSEDESEGSSTSKDGHVAYDSDTTTAAAKKEDDLFERVGSKSQNSYDRLSVVLSDMARFVLCHRFGGTYLDADTILLRDWEELWGWKGAFAYRWSRLEKYNTAVLRLNKGSALGSFLFKTALRNGLDFHPMTISRYTKEAYLEGLLLRLPDALFDSAWLNTEYYQRDRPPFPYFQAFEDFFNTRTQDSAGPQALGFDGFFKGAYSYHFHNFWWEPFDRSRNFPDLGERFIANERRARLKLLQAAAATASNSTGSPRLPTEDTITWQDKVSEDQRDLGWATVLKRTFESYIRGERPNMYGEWLDWS